MTYLSKNQIKAINIEHTSKCNLLCPQCARVVDGKINPFLHINSMTLDDYKRIIPPSFCKQIEHIFFCGNYGDPLADQHFIECVKYLKENDIKLTIYTNGSLMPVEWWEDLAHVLNSNDKVVFAIDGLKDTSNIYRVNSNYDKVIRNAKVFIDNGGVARWDYLVFEYNHHQINEAQRIAKNIGFKTFNKKITQRFIANKNYKNSKGEGKFGQIIEKYGSWENYIDHTEIKCKYQKDSIIYIDFDLNLWPCCWVGAPLFFYGKDNIQQQQIKILIEKYGKGFNSLKTYSINEVLNHPWFKNDLCKSWYKNMSNGKLMTCGRTCGSEYKFSSGDKSNRKEIQL